MQEQEKLYEQYEDAVFALLMDKVAEENGKKCSSKMKHSLQTQMRPSPKRWSKRCLRTIEKAYRNRSGKPPRKSDTGAQSGCLVDSGSALFCSAPLLPLQKLCV